MILLPRAPNNRLELTIPEMPMRFSGPSTTTYDISVSLLPLLRAWGKILTPS